MTSKKNDSRPRLATTPSSGTSSPAVSTVYAAGESSLSEATSALVHKKSTASLANATVRSIASSSSLRNELDMNLADSDDWNRPGSRKSWFGRSRKGTWPKSGKLSPVTKVMQENASREISGAAVVEQEPAGSGSVALLSDKKVPDKPGTKPVGQSDSSMGSLPKPAQSDPPAQLATLTSEPSSASAIPRAVPGGGGANNEDTIPPSLMVAQSTNYLWGWWYGQPAAMASAAVETKEPTEENQRETEENQRETMSEVAKEPDTKGPQEQPTALPLLREDNNASVNELGVGGPVDTTNPARPRSWLGFWGSGNVESLDATDGTDNQTPTPVTCSATAAEPEPARIPSTDLSQTGAAKQPSASAGAGYGWGFWSKESKPAGSSAAGILAGPTEGEVVVADGSSEPIQQKAKVKQPEALTGTALKPVSSRPIPRRESRLDTSNSSSSKATGGKLTSATSNNSDPSGAAPPPLQSFEVEAVENSAAKEKLQKILPRNHVLPSFNSCYRCPAEPSFLQFVTNPFRPPQLSKDHLYLVRHPPHIKKAVAIGVHGFFPVKLVRTVLGEPTGTSIRFANHAASSIKRWAEKNGIEVEVEKIALEGEGKVADRVEMLWKLLQNWMDHVRSADFVFMTAHSQGVIVGMQLLARLIGDGCVDKARIGFTAMAGINLGPFSHLPTTLLTGSARELFEFQKQESTASNKYMEALRIVLAHNVRILYVGSIDDQLVPLESSTITNISHPYIYRAVFVDGRVHAPDFLSHLVGFAMKLRNLGVSDHGLIRELSSPLAGSLYGGGHSRIYDEGAVYDLGVSHALETGDCDGVPLKVERFDLPSNGNPYFLPWSLRGMLEEALVRTQLSDECGQLLKQFEDWKPVSKTLKDVKFRLEGIRSKI